MCSGRGPGEREGGDSGHGAAGGVSLPRRQGGGPSDQAGGGQGQLPPAGGQGHGLGGGRPGQKSLVVSGVSLKGEAGLSDGRGGRGSVGGVRAAEEVRGACVWDLAVGRH